MDTAPLLRSIALFDGLGEDDLQALAVNLKRRRWNAGQVIFVQGAAGNAMYIIERGDVNIHLPGEASRRVSLADLSHGEFFGELALFDEEPRSATALAATDVELLELDHEALGKYLESRPRAAMAFLQTLAKRLRETNAMLSGRVARDVDAELDKKLTWSDRLADVVAEFNGSWKFIFILIALTAIWCVINTGISMESPPDPYPYQLYNLALGILVGLQGPLIVMSQNRQAKKDRARADTDFKVNLKNEVNIETLLRELAELRVDVANATHEKLPSQHN